MLTGKPPFTGSQIEILHQIESYNDRLAFPSHISPVAQDFILCCLRRNPFNRMNVYKLLAHPFIEAARDTALEEDKTELGRSRLADPRNDSVSRVTAGGTRKDKQPPKLNLRRKEDAGELSISNYERVVSDVERKGGKDQVILDLQRDLDDKTSAIENRLKAKKLSQTESKATPKSESELHGLHFFPHDLSQAAPQPRDPREVREARDGREIRHLRK